MGRTVKKRRNLKRKTRRKRKRKRRRRSPNLSLLRRKTRRRKRRRSPRNDLRPEVFQKCSSPCCSLCNLCSRDGLRIRVIMHYHAIPATTSSPTFYLQSSFIIFVLWSFMFP